MPYMWLYKTLYHWLSWALVKAW